MNEAEYVATVLSRLRDDWCWHLSEVVACSENDGPAWIVEIHLKGSRVGGHYSGGGDTPTEALSELQYRMEGEAQGQHALAVLYESDLNALEGAIAIAEFEGATVDELCESCGTILADMFGLCPDCYDAKREFENEEVEADIRREIERDEEQGLWY